MQTMGTLRPAFSIFINTSCEGTLPLWYDERGLPVTYATERDAQTEIVDDLQARLHQFVMGERDFEDAVTIEEFILPVDVRCDGSISIADGSTFSRRS
jgi:hypothetical protein